MEAYGRSSSGLALSISSKRSGKVAWSVAWSENLHASHQRLSVKATHKCILMSGMAADIDVIMFDSNRMRDPCRDKLR